MTYALAAVEQAMTRQEAILRALSGRQPWLQVAEVLGVTARTVRRRRWRYEHYGYDGWFDRRRRRPSPRWVPLDEVQRVLGLYREHYVGFNARHFCDMARRQHGLALSDSFVKQALQGAACCPNTGHAGATAAVITALRTVFQTYGLPIALYTDRAHWAVHTPTSGGVADRTKPTQLGRALQRLGIEPILGYSPQARGRSERANRTLQGRLVNERRLAGITTPLAANAYLRDHFLAAYDASFARPPADPASAFVALGRTDLEQILCHEETRVVGRDNTVAFDTLTLQIDKQRGRRSCAGLRVLVRRHLNGQPSIWCGPRRFGLYDRYGRPLSLTGVARPRPPRRTDHVSNRSRTVLASR